MFKTVNIVGAALFAAFVPQILNAQMTCDRAAGKKLYFSGGNIQDEPILEGMHVMRTGVAGPTVTLLCEAEEEQIKDDITCEADVSDVRVLLAADGTVSAKCLRRTAPPPRPKSVEEELPVSTESTSGGGNQ